MSAPAASAEVRRDPRAAFDRQNVIETASVKFDVATPPTASRCHVRKCHV
jgi:hypothetical protein